jgi:hypothetical protein
MPIVYLRKERDEQHARQGMQDIHAKHMLDMLHVVLRVV